LGFAYLAQGDLAQAIPRLEQAIQQCIPTGYWPIVGWFDAWLSEALYLNRELDKARDVAMQAFEISREAKNPYGVAYAQRVLGQVAQASGVLTEAYTHLSAALDTFTAIQSRFEAGRTHLTLSELTYAQGNREAATAHANNAYALFMALKTLRYVERTQQFASQYRLVLSNADILHLEHRNSETLR
jgi:tetratricopeptide (TPR) repeat protein